MTKNDILSKGGLQNRMHMLVSVLLKNSHTNRKKYQEKNI